MSTYDERARSQAIRNLAPIAKGGKGQAVRIETPARDGQTDPMTDRTTGGSPPVDENGSGVETKYRAESVDGDLVQRGDVQLLLSPVTVDGMDLSEIVSDLTTVTKADGLWLVKHVDTIKPTGLFVMHKLQLRRGG